MDSWGQFTFTVLANAGIVQAATILSNDSAKYLFIVALSADSLGFPLPPIVLQLHRFATVDVALLACYSAIYIWHKRGKLSVW